MLEFALVTINKAREIFTDIAIKGFLFHFSQEIRRKFVNSGLRVAYIYKNNFINKNDARKLMTLTLGPEFDVTQVFGDTVQNVQKDVLQICDHIELFYLKGQ